MEFLTKSFRKDETLYSAITSKSEDKYVVKVVKWSEFHLSEMTLLQNPYFSGKMEKKKNEKTLTLPKSSSPSSTNPKVYFVRECKTSKQCILSPFAIGRSKLTRAKILGLGIPKGESRLAIKSDNWLKLMNWVAWGSYLKTNVHNISIKSIEQSLHEGWEGLVGLPRLWF